MKNSAKIFIDFDDTLFNTAALKKSLVEIFKANGVSKSDFFSSYTDYPTVMRGSLKKYDPYKQIEVLHKKLGIKKTKIKSDLEKMVRSSRKFVFRDAHPFLKNFEREDLFLVSFAKTDFQCRKIENSGLREEFSKVIVSDKPKAEIIGKIVGNKKTKIIFIDDRIDQIDAVKKKFSGSATFLMARRNGRFKERESKFVDFEVKNLKEAERIIRNKISKSQALGENKKQKYEKNTICKRRILSSL
jgi:FMN phosphatase YigB (HAD superfamily)